jgi:hypothetical protein
MQFGRLSAEFDNNNNHNDNLFSIHKCYTTLKECTKQYTGQCTIQSPFDEYPLPTAYQAWMTTPSNSR